MALEETAERSPILLVSLDTGDSHRVHSRVDLFLQDSVLELRRPLGGNVLHENKRLEKPGRASWDRDPHLSWRLPELCISRLHSLSLHVPLTGASRPAA